MVEDGCKTQFPLGGRKIHRFFLSKFRFQSIFLGWSLVKRHVASVTYFRLEDAGIIPLLAPGMQVLFQ